MIDRFLKAKHWQLFILMFGIPMLFQIIMMVSMFSNINLEGNSDPEEIFKVFNMFKFIPLIMILYIFVFFGWFWSIAIGLQNKIPENIKMKTTKFKVFFFIPILYIVCISIGMFVMFGGIVQARTMPTPNSGFVVGMFGIIMPLHLLSVFGIFYAMYFTAKTFKTVELQKEVKFGDFAGEFFMIWFYFIGIWILQPKINKMVQSEYSDSNSMNTI